jgi:phytoene dehydrogenase-like protein
VICFVSCLCVFVQLIESLTDRGEVEVVYGAGVRSLKLPTDSDFGSDLATVVLSDKSEVKEIKARLVVSDGRVHTVPGLLPVLLWYGVGWCGWWQL